MDELSLDNIMDESEVDDLFGNPQERQAEAVEESEGEKKEPEKEKDNNEEATEVDPEDLFGSPESVGSEEDKKEKEGAASDKDADTSPNFYSSIAGALVEDSIFQNLDKDKVAEIKTAEDFSNAIEDEIKSRLDEAQKRVLDCLEAGVEPSEVQRHERILQFLDGLQESQITAETEEGENIRKNLIYQEFVNRGFTKERAQREVDRSFKSGTDIEDAKLALQSNKDFYKDEYDNLIKKAQEEKKQEEDSFRKQAEDLRKAILDNDKAFGEIPLDKGTRQKIYDSVMKPVYRDPETGERLTAIQKYESENRNEFLKNVALCFHLTDGFKNLDKLVQPRVNKEVRKGLKELEKTINNTARTSTGNLNFTSGVGSESAYKKYELDI